MKTLLESLKDAIDLIEVPLRAATLSEVENRKLFNIKNVLAEEAELARQAAEINKNDKTPDYYDNSNGSLYKFAEDNGLNSWEFDIVKRVVRSRGKGQFKQDLEKTKTLIDLYLKEYS